MKEERKCSLEDVAKKMPNCRWRISALMNNAKKDVFGNIFTSTGPVITLVNVSKKSVYPLRAKKI